MVVSCHQVAWWLLPGLSCCQPTLCFHPCCSLVAVCSWSLPALQAGLIAALPALALVAIQELGPWAKVPDQQQYTRYVQLMEEVNESDLVDQTDL